MLIEFSVENFRSIRFRQTLSMVAASRLKKKENAIAAPVTGERFPALLKAVAIYGPNASGKSSVFKAMELLKWMVLAKPSAEDRRLPASSFRFDPELRDEPSRFEVHFVEAGVRYAFEMALSAERIHEERLSIYVKGVEHELYARKYLAGHDTYTFGEMLEGGSALHEAWRQLTGPQVLFLSQAVANSNEEINQLRKPFMWLSDDLMFESHGMRDSARYTQRLIADLPSFGQEVADLLSDVDVPVSAIRSTLQEETKLGLEHAEKNRANEPNGNLRALYSKSQIKTTLTHRSTLGEADFDLSEESDGTQNLLGFALPWFIFRQDGKDTRTKVLFVDELDSSLHPKLVEALVERHLKSDLKCQLIFTTHDTHLMDTKLLRRDQIWFTERDETGATQLRSVHDFEGREGEDVEKRYYEGRYRALPFVRRS